MSNPMEQDSNAQTGTAGDSARIVIRRAQPEDAARIIAYLRPIFAEPGINLITEPDEFVLTVEAEQRFIRDLHRSGNSLFLVAEADGQIVGQLTLEGGRRRNVRHAAVLGITVGKAWRGRGVGRRLIEYAVEWARSSGVVTRIELHVFTRNEGALRLYETCGFVIEGRRRGSVRRDGELLDDYVMGLLL